MADTDALDTQLPARRAMRRKLFIGLLLGVLVLVAMGLYADGRAQLVEADGGEAEGSLLVLELLQRAYQPQVAPSLRSLHALARGARCEALRSLRTRLRLIWSV